jgi:hypothetical protein
LPNELPCLPLAQSFVWEIAAHFGFEGASLSQQALLPGAVFAEVGGPPENGNWHSHLHVQAIRAGLFHEILLDRFRELDGYGHPNATAELQQDFPDPRPYIGL